MKRVLQLLLKNTESCHIKSKSHEKYKGMNVFCQKLENGPLNNMFLSGTFTLYVAIHKYCTINTF